MRTPARIACVGLPAKDAAAKIMPAPRLEDQRLPFQARASPTAPLTLPAKPATAMVPAQAQTHASVKMVGTRL